MPETSLGWTVAGLAIIALVIVIWRWPVHPSGRAGLVVIASAGITLAMSGTFWSLLLLGLGVALVALTWQLAGIGRVRRHVNSSWIVALVLLLTVTKLSFTTSLIGPAVWVGVSYMFLRLIHVMIDTRHGRLGEVSLPQMLTYVLHPTTLVAGPIDRVQHSINEQCHPLDEPASYFNEGFWRLLTGLVKKMLLANAFFSITVTYDAINGTPPIIGAWIWVFAYAFYLYFDFAAYSDVAIGVGLLMGMRLPENFANPYLQPSITQFWQSWHITLSTWMRDYIFFPTSRYLIKRFGSRFSPLILLVSHLVTMVSSGLWHGLRLEMVAWGVWHGLGLYAYNRWGIIRRRYHLPGIPKPASILITYLFVSLGFVFFSMRFTHAVGIFARLFGLR